MEPVVQLIGVGRRYSAGEAEIAALDDVSLDVAAGEFVAVMGSTGSGKSTLLHCAAGLERPSAGTVRLVGRDLGPMREAARTRLRRDSVGVVFQSFNLLSELTVAQNVLLPQRLGGPRARPLPELLASVELDGLEHRPVGLLSGGQRQRVAVARALAGRPAVVFADEPTGSLDPTTGAQVLGLLRTAVDIRDVAVVMVTHDPLAAAFSDRLVLLRHGRIVGDGPTPDAGTIASRLRAVSTGAGPLLPQAVSR
jgi:putative ABC transport system ATP-binding protein